MLLSLSVETPGELSEVFEKLEDIVIRLHQCNYLEDLLTCGVEQTRQIFGADRALIYQFTDAGDGAVTAESVASDWLPTLGQLIYDPCFENRWGEKFRRGDMTAIADVAQASLDPCYRDLMQRLQVRANLVSPILIRNPTEGIQTAPHLWGLLILHQCGAPYDWQPVHHRVLKQLATQLGIAIRTLEQAQRLSQTRQHQTQWQIAIETAECGVWEWAVDRDEIVYSEQWHALLGGDDRNRGQTLEEWQTLVHPDDWDSVQTAIEQHLTRQTPAYHCEYRLRRDDGHWLWVSSRGKVTSRRPDNTPLRMVGLISDIRDRKQREQALEHQTRREHVLNEVIQAIRDSLNLQEIFTVAAAQIADCLDAQTIIFEYLAAAACWRPVAIDGPPSAPNANQFETIWSDIPDEDNPIAVRLKALEVVRVEDTAIIGGDDPINQVVAQLLPGQWLLIPIAIQAQAWGCIALIRPSGQSWSATDIQFIQRIAAQLAIAIHHAKLHQQLQTAHERDALVLHSINEGIWDLNPATGVVAVSPQYWQLLGYPVDTSSVSSFHEELQRVHPDDQDQLLTFIGAHFEAQTQFAIELRMRHCQGHYIWIRNRGRAVWDQRGNPVRMLGAIEDISDRKTLEMRLRQQEKDFRSLVENNPDGIMRVDRQFRVMYLNPIMASRTELSQSNCVGRQLCELGMSGAMVARWEAAIAQVFTTAQEQLLETQEISSLGRHTFYSRIVPEFYSNDEIISVMIISRDVSNLRDAQTALQHQYEREHALRQITQHIRETLDLDQILSTAVAEVQRLLQADRTLIVQIHPDQSAQVIAEVVRSPYPSTLSMRWENDHFHQECVAFYAQGRGRIVPDVTQDDWSFCSTDTVREIEVKSKMVVPIVQSLDEQSVVWGLLMTHACSHHRLWQPDELSLLQNVAGQLAIAIQQSELHQQLQAANQALEHISITDELTQVANRRYFDQVLEQEWRRGLRERRELALVLCDIDHFKQYNDTYGHPTGDACIVAVAGALASCANRATDCIARYGGEEFAAILPHTDTQGAIALVEQMQAAIAELQIEHPTVPGNRYLTLSFGIATIVPQAALSSQALVVAADRALYRAKQAGRDRHAVVPPLSL